MNTFKMAVAAVCIMFLSTACSKKLMPPEIGASNGGVESSDFTESAMNTTDGSMGDSDGLGGTGGAGDGFFSEEPILEGTSDGGGLGVSGGNGSGMTAGSSFDSASGPDGSAGSSGNGFGSGGQANIGNGSTGSYDGNPFNSGNGDNQVANVTSLHSTSDLKDIHFNFDQYDLDSNSKKVLQQNAAYLKLNPGMKVEIQGHCDERGTNNYNIALGERRAHSTKKFLVSQGVDSSRVNIISYGEEKPFCFDSNENCWFQNRRAHFMVAK